MGKIENTVNCFLFGPYLHMPKDHYPPRRPITTVLSIPSSS